MSARRPRAGRGRGRGRGRGSTMIWEWESYTPSPAVYDNIWHIRQAPVSVSPHVPDDCPIPDALTRILERRQTEDGLGRNFYFVEITYLGGQEQTGTWVQSSDERERGGTEVERVDVSRILQYVSPRELERFENEQFRVEAEAQAVADREDEQEQVRRRMEKNARVAGRGRGRSRGGGGGRWRGRGGLLSGSASHRELPQGEIIDGQPSQTHTQGPPTSRDDITKITEIAEITEITEATETTETSMESEQAESEDDLSEPTSPGLMRSAFVANSALPLSSPVRLRRPAPPKGLQQRHAEAPHVGDIVTAAADNKRAYVSSAAVPLQFARRFGGIAAAESESASSDDDDVVHPSKRRKTESVEPQQTLMFPPSSQIAESDSGREAASIPADPPSTVKVHKYHDANLAVHNTPRAAPSAPHHSNLEIDTTADGSEDEDAEEYVVESVIEHYYDDDGRKYYLVKWQGYDSHDWLPSEDLEGAAELCRPMALSAADPCRSRLLALCRQACVGRWSIHTAPASYTQPSLLPPRPTFTTASRRCRISRHEALPLRSRNPATIVGLTAGALTLATSLLPAVLGLETGIDEFKSIDETLQGFAGEVVAFRSVLFILQTELGLIEKESNSEVPAWWDRDALTTLLTNAASTFSRLEAVVSNIQGRTSTPSKSRTSDSRYKSTRGPWRFPSAWPDSKSRIKHAMTPSDSTAFNICPV
ncbi:hypothetical protein BU25DRAFT_424202 [Macroventuria anomochaeta]|uniref:Uncharacterized protein n=1 Tax=Macroventuria anomochaeta TaxID=301207 RepID=A0ACB6RRV9_9PLEO|nr:uncharacterized protein BU25DRAFT_424202 [Macroventuria anomochaeta]KAF2624437.1 hypothetical protein BU25DRAFT_424202 [Macroventuria anomochaeta]